MVDPAIVPLVTAEQYCRYLEAQINALEDDLASKQQASAIATRELQAFNSQHDLASSQSISDTSQFEFYQQMLSYINTVIEMIDAKVHQNW
jgi:hypothetical protein